MLAAFKEYALNPGAEADVAPALQEMLECARGFEGYLGELRLPPAAARRGLAGPGAGAMLRARHSGHSQAPAIPGPSNPS